MSDNIKEIRRGILEMAMETGINHIASSLSVVEILCVLFSIAGEDDKIILSKGHGCLGYYILLQTKGYRPTLKAHPDMDIENGIECTTGSLGHGLPMGVGMAIAKKLKKEKGTIYVIVGDGECQEGTTWESAMIVSHNKLDNLCIIVDKNGMQALCETDSATSLGDLASKFIAFGLSAFNVNGHDVGELRRVFRCESTRPKVVIAHTVKGKGISFMENNAKFHARLPNNEELEIARRELA